VNLVKSPVKEKLMRILLDGAPHPEIELARGAGFTRASTIQKWTRSFEGVKFIVRRPTGEKGEFQCQLRLTRDTVRKIYHYPEFRQIRPLIRQAPWFGPLFLHQFTGLPGNLPSMIQEMIKKSHTFFEFIDRYDTHEKVREIFYPILYFNELQGITDEEINSWCLYYQLYVHSVVQDLSGGGLGEGFMDLMRDVQARIKELPVRRGGIRRANG
jgi:hypothetical protein